MPPLPFFPLYYQLLEAYHPSNYVPSTPTIIVETVPTPITPTLSVNSNRKTVDLTLFGDSMINTLSPDICQKSLQKYFPTIKFNLLKYGYSSTDIESASGQFIPLIPSQNMDIFLIESFAYNNFGNSQTGIDRQSQALQNLIDLIKKQSKNTKIILAATIAPNSVVFANSTKEIRFSALEKIEKTNTIKLYLQNLINFSEKNNLPLANAYYSSLFNQNGLEELISSTDFIHPSPLGSELFCDTVAKSILDNQLIN